MSKHMVRKCDGCGKYLDRVSEAYHITLSTDRFWQGADLSTLSERLDFCRACASSLLETMENIAKRLESMAKRLEGEQD